MEVKDLHDGAGEPALGLVRVALHEEHHGFGIYGGLNLGPRLVAD
jgi:hypothetical protein